MMIIQCPHCKARYKLNPDYFKGDTIVFQCRKCPHTLRVKKDSIPNEKRDDHIKGTGNVKVEAPTIVQAESHVQPQLKTQGAEKSSPSSIEKMGEKDVSSIESNKGSSTGVKASPTEPTVLSKVSESSTTKKILVADDEVSICILVDEILSSAGYYVITARDGLEAFNMVKSEQPDLVVLDLLMPKMTGFEVLKEIRKLDRDLPVLVMTAIYKKASQVLVVKELGANGYLEKPFSPDHLLFRVENLLLEKKNNSPIT